jgi:hypothetical protein
LRGAFRKTPAKIGVSGKNENFKNSFYPVFLEAQMYGFLPDMQASKQKDFEKKFCQGEEK